MTERISEDFVRHRQPSLISCLHHCPVSDQRCQSGLRHLLMDNVDERPSSAGAYYSQDFEWETLRDEVERMPEFVSQQVHSIVASNESALPSLLKDSGQAPPSTSTSWETFHTRHSRNHFFKERRYLTKEFPELCQTDKLLSLLEVGCGTGSSLVPIVRENKHAVVYACDCSAAALKKATEYISSATASSSFHPFLCDISLSKLPEFLCCAACRRRNNQSSGEVTGGTELLVNDRKESHEQFDNNNRGFDAASSTLELRSPPGHSSAGCCVGGLDIVTMIFTLSAIPVEKTAHVLSECFDVLKPGGLLLFRDYGLYDMTMLRFAPRHRISSCLYQRDDGTLSYFFSLEMVRSLLTGVGFLERELEYCCVQLMNRRKQVPMKRVWIHAKFQKPNQT